jgi:radial spoke head protein 1
MIVILGEFEEGKKHGEGLYTYPNKDVYSGRWENGKKHGQGTYVFNETAMRFTGRWHENKLIEGKWLFPNGNYY